MKQRTMPTTPATEAQPSPEIRLDEIEPGPVERLLDVAECVDDTHPTLRGRVRVRLHDRERWIACLASVTPRVGDHLLIANVAEGTALVVGVVDGVRARRPEATGLEHVRRIRDDEVIVIESSAGEPIVEVRAEAGRTTLRMLAASSRLEAAGKLELAGESVEILASKGSIVLDANEDVRVAGENIFLN